MIINHSLKTWELMFFPPVVSVSNSICKWFSLKFWGQGLPWWHSSEESTCQCRKMGSIPDPGRFHMLWSSWGHEPQLLSLRSRARGPQLPSSCAAATEIVCREPVLYNRGHCSEKSGHHNGDPAQAKTKVIKSKKKPAWTKQIQISISYVHTLYINLTPIYLTWQNF